MKKITSVICIIFAFIMIMALPVGASSPYQTYTYSISGKALYSPDAYTPAKTVNSSYMGLKTELSNPRDIEVDDQGNVYIADTDNNRIIVLDRYYKLKFSISTFINGQGVPDKLVAPQGVFITSDKMVGTEYHKGKIYVCDTNNNRIVTFDRDGNFDGIIAQPESELFEEGAVYMPVAVAVDKYDRLYVVSSSTYQGVIVMTAEGEFTGFIGAQKVVMSTWDQIWRRFQTEEQKNQSMAYVSTEFNNVTLYDDFVYVTTAGIDEAKVQSAITSKSKSGDYAPVKMLNASGTEIMRRNGFYPPSGEVDMKALSVSDSIFGVSTIVDVACGPEKTWSIIDSKRSKVFTYDYDGTLLFAFGDTGKMLGNITKDGLAGVVYQDDNILLLDRIAKTFTVYERTEYGDILIKALENQNNRNYDQAIDDWMEILKRNSNFDSAYIGIGNALYRNNDLKESLEYFSAAYDTSNYTEAYQDLRTEWMKDYIILIPIVVIGVCLLWSMFLKKAKKINKRVATSGEKKTFGKELIYVFHVIFHPFDGFWDLKHEKRGSVRASATILVMVVAAFYYQNIGQGYLLNPTGKYSSLMDVILSIAAPFALWTIANWCLTTLFEGEGSFKDIFIATSYALMPMVLILIPTTIISNVLTLNELDILSVVNAFAFIWTGLLIFCGMMVTHDYSMGKNILTTLGTILGMVVIMFIAILFTTLLGKLVSFVTNIVTEIQFRM